MGGSGTIILLFLMNAIFRGAGDTTTPTLVNLFCYWLWEIPLAYALAIRYPRGPDGQFNPGRLPAHPERESTPMLRRTTVWEGNFRAAIR